MTKKEIWINISLDAQAKFMAKLEKDGLDISYFKEMYEEAKDNELCQHCAKSFTICRTKDCLKFRNHEDGHIYLICSGDAKEIGYARIHNAADAFRVLARKLNKYVKGITENGEGVSSNFFTTNYSLFKHFGEMNKTIMTNIGKYPEYFIESEGIRMYLITNTIFREHVEDDMLKEHEALINMWLNRRDEAIKPQTQTDKKVEIEVKVSVNETDTSKKEVKKDRVEPVPTPTSSIIIDESYFKERNPHKITIKSNKFMFVTRMLTSNEVSIIGTKHGLYDNQIEDMLNKYKIPFRKYEEDDESSKYVLLSSKDRVTIGHIVSEEEMNKITPYNSGDWMFTNKYGIDTCFHNSCWGDTGSIIFDQVVIVIYD